MPTNMFIDSSNSSLPLRFGDCIIPETRSIIVSILVPYVLMVPLFLLILVMGYQRWRRRPFGSPSSTHLDVFTHNVAVLDLLGVLGACFYSSGIFTGRHDVTVVGSFLYFIISPGQTLFHLLTCADRYLAVVHPVSYRALRRAAGVRIRNVAVGCAWLLSLIVTFLVTWFNVSFTSINVFLLVFTFVAFCSCSLAVMCVLVRPGPGEGGRKGERADRSKQRALHTMMVITGVLLLRFLVSLVTNTIRAFSRRFGHTYCLVGLSALWFSLPSSLVLPFLFLQRVGKIPGWRCSSNGGA